MRVYIGKEITVLGKFIHKHVMAKVSSYEMLDRPDPSSLNCAETFIELFDYSVGMTLFDSLTHYSNNR